MRFKFLLTHTHTYHSTIFIRQLPRSNGDTICTLTLSFPIHVTSSLFDQSLSFTRNLQIRQRDFLHFNLPFSFLPCTRYIRVTFCSIFIVCSHFSDPVESRINRVTGKDRRCRSPRIEGKGEVRLALVGTHRDY